MLPALSYIPSAAAAVAMLCSVETTSCSCSTSHCAQFKAARCTLDRLPWAPARLWDTSATSYKVVSIVHPPSAESGVEVVVVLVSAWCMGSSWLIRFLVVVYACGVKSED